MGSTMNSSQQHVQSGIAKVILMLLASAAVLTAPVTAQAGNVGWVVSVGGGNGGGYGGGYSGGWRPVAYGPGWGGGYGGGWRGGYYGPANVYPYNYPYVNTYYSPQVVYATQPVVTYVTSPQPIVLASQPQPPVWYFCEASGQYFPYVQSCTSGWQVQPAIPPTSKTISNAPRRN